MPATNKYTKGIGERIRLIRRGAHLQQDEFGQKLGLTRQSISAYENERGIPSRRVIAKMCDLFGVSPAWLHYGVGNFFQNLETVSEIPMPAHVPGSGEELTSEQRTLIEYVKSNEAMARRLAKLLLDQGLMQVEQE